MGYDNWQTDLAHDHYYGWSPRELDELYKEPECTCWACGKVYEENDKPFCDSEDGPICSQECWISMN